MPATPPATPLDPEQLLAEDPFVRRLARSLLRDGDAADDLAQQTWVAALERPPDPGALRSWLAAVMRRLAGRHLRDERRQAARQREGARSERVPSTVEIVAREALRSEVLRAVLELDEPYRAVVLLRWFEHLPPRAIARRLELPVETVRTRAKRALALLRARLDAHCGGRPAWTALLLPSLGRPWSAALLPGPGAIKMAVAGGMMMLTKTKLAAGAALGSLLLFALWMAPFLPPFGSAAPPAPTPEPPPIAGIAPEAGPALAAVTDGAAAARKLAPAPPAATTGSLEVEVLWAGDPRPAGDPGPAADVLVEVHRFTSDPLLDKRRARTDATGLARFDALPPGRIHVSLLHRDSRNSGGGSRVEVFAGQRARARLTIEMGMDVRGMVVDGHGRPVAGADVLVASWTGMDSLPLGRSDADGRFLLRAIETHCHIGARAPGCSPSPMRTFTGSAGGEVEFTIVLESPGSGLCGVVLDPRGRPLAGALVQAGDGRQRPLTLADGGRGHAPRAELLTTDAGGRFEFHSLPPGRLPLAVRARGLAPIALELDLPAGSVLEQTVRLLPGVTLIGTVRDAIGAPVVRARIGAGDRHDLSHRSCHTDDKGVFRLEGLSAGKLDLRASSDEHGSNTSKTLMAGAGDTLRWDVVLASGIELRGRVLDHAGEPVAGAMIDVRQKSPAPGSTFRGRHTRSDAEGRFRLLDCTADTPLTITVRRTGVFPEATLRRVLPGAEELAIRLPAPGGVRIRGKVVNPDGEPLANVRVSPYNADYSAAPVETTDATTGTFDLGPYPPGEYSLGLFADGYPPVRFPPRAVARGETWDVGTVDLQPGGFLTATLRAAAGGRPMPESVHLGILDTKGRFCGQMHLEHGRGRAGPLAAGDYRLQVGVPGTACVQLPFRIQPSTTTPIDVQLQAGVPVGISFILPDEHPQGARVMVVLTDEQGREILRSYARSRSLSGAPRLDAVLAPGTYRVGASAATLSGKARFVVGAGQEPVAVQVRLAL